MTYKMYFWRALLSLVLVTLLMVAGINAAQQRVRRSRNRFAGFPWQRADQGAKDPMDEIRASVSRMSDWFDGVFQGLTPKTQTRPAVSVAPLPDPSDWIQDWFGTPGARPRSVISPIGSASLPRTGYPHRSGVTRGSQPRYPWQRPSRTSQMMGDIFTRERGGGRPNSGRSYTWTYTGGSTGGAGRLGIGIGGGGGGGGRGLGGGRDRSGGLGTSTWNWPPPVPRLPSFPRLDLPDVDSFRNTFFRNRPQWHQQFNHHLHHQSHRRPGSTRPNAARPSIDSTVSSGPAYETVCRGRHYTARRYNDSVWVSAVVVNGSSLDALLRIKAYFTGQNDQGVILMMSRPLRMTVASLNDTISDTEATIEDFVLSAMVPPEFQTNPPLPLDITLNITIEPSHTAYVTHFRRERRPGTPAVYDEYFDLHSALESANEMFTHGFFHTAFYETWSEIFSSFPSNMPRPGEILIPGGPAHIDLECMTEGPSQRGPQNGIKQCGRSKCPEYETLQRLRHDIELRRVQGATYVTRTAPACILSLPTITSHFALQRYLSGKNSESRSYPSPAPFFHYVYPSRFATCFCKQTMTSAYMLPANQSYAQPTERNVKVHTQPDRDVYVMKFAGRPTARRVEAKFDALRKFLRRSGLCFIRDKYVFAIYDHPFNRPPYLNEVMVFRKPGDCRWSDNDFDVDGDSWEGDIPVNATTAATPSTPEPTTTTGRAPPSGDRTTPTLPAFGEDLVPLALETNSIESLNTDLVPYRFSGNYTDFPEDFPTDVFVY